MPRVVPTQVVELIDTLFPEAKNEAEGKSLRLSFDQSILLNAILGLVDQIPSELIVLGSQQYAEYMASISAIRWSLERWQGMERASRTSPLLSIPGLRQHSPVVLIRQALPDEFPATGTDELSFISDEDFRRSLRIDYSAVNKALSNGEWKAATVLAGSAVEALLLWALQQRKQLDVDSSVKKLVGNNVIKKPHPDLKQWTLHMYIEVAEDLGIISQETATQARLAKDYRNLIHPGRAERLGRVCNRATTLSAVGALEHVVTDLTP